MARVIKAQPIDINDDLVTALRGPARGFLLGAVREAYRDGLYREEPAGPGWGTHNRILRMHDGEPYYTGEELWYGDWLATVQEV